MTRPQALLCEALARAYEPNTPLFRFDSEALATVVHDVALAVEALAESLTPDDYRAIFRDLKIAATRGGGL